MILEQNCNALSTVGIHRHLRGGPCVRRATSGLTEPSYSAFTFPFELRTSVDWNRRVHLHNDLCSVMWFRSHAASIRGTNRRWESSADQTHVSQQEGREELVHEALSSSHRVETSLNILWEQWPERETSKSFLMTMHQLSLEAKALCQHGKCRLRASYNCLIQEFSDVRRRLLQQRTWHWTVRM